MHHYDILIVLTKSSAEALSVKNHSGCEPVSIDGNRSMQYTGNDDLERFVSHIKDAYNIDSFADFDFTVLIVNCGGSKESAQYLYGQFADAARSSFVQAEHVIAFVAAAKQKLKNGGEYSVKIGDCAYYLSISPEGRTSCVLSEGKTENAVQVEISAPDFAALFSADVSVFGNADEEIAKISDGFEQKIAGLKAQAEKDTADLQSKLDEALAKFEDALSRLSKWQRKRSVCWSGNYEPSGSQSVYGFMYRSSSSSSRTYRREIQMTKTDGDSVKAFDEIATVRIFEGKATVNYSYKYTITAGQDGKVFYLSKNSQNIPANSPIAIIADEQDSKEDALLWFASAKGAIPKDTTTPLRANEKLSVTGEELAKAILGGLFGMAEKQS